MVREKIKAGLITEGTYDPTEMTNEPTAAAFKLEWGSACRREDAFLV